jgi:hypothetical protein
MKEISNWDIREFDVRNVGLRERSEKVFLSDER